jgi:demethylspheroidene O-methyltransferase
MLFDLPAVAARARVQNELHGLGGRISTCGGSFLDDELPRGADIATLVRVIFDHPDERAMHILRAVHRALPAGGTLLLAEPLSGTPGAERMGDAYFGVYLLAMGRGRARSFEAMASLLTQAGFTGVRKLHTDMPLHTAVIVATVHDKT